MKDNDWKKRLNVVFSTNPDFNYEQEDEVNEESLKPNEQRLRVGIDRRNRRGKTVTLISGFKGSSDKLKALEKDLKSKCGVGGSSKDGEIIIQGDFKSRVHDLLKEMGYSQTKMKG